MRCMKKLLLLSLAWVWLIPVAMAQQQVSGTVTDYSNGEPLPGVNIIIKGTTNGTITDIDGAYRIDYQVIIFVSRVEIHHAVIDHIQKTIVVEIADGAVG